MPHSGANLFGVLLSIVVGLALVGTVATSTNSGSTALAGFTSAQNLVIIIPLIFVAIILYGAWSHMTTAGKRQFEFDIKLFAYRFVELFLDSWARVLNQVSKILPSHN